MAKVSSVPRLDRTIWCPTDTHVGHGASDVKLPIVADDLVNGIMLPSRVAHVHHSGDTQEAVGVVNSQPEADDFVAWWNDTRYIADGTPFSIAPGNHDLYTWTPAQWAASLSALNQPTAHYSMPLGDFGRIIVPYTPNGVLFTADELAWIDAELTAHSSVPCVIGAHAPLWNTFMTDDTTAWWSTKSGFYSRMDGAYSTSAGILAVLDAHDNAVCWLSGHCHPDINKYAPLGRDFVLEVDCGTRNIVHANLPAVKSNGGVTQQAMPQVWSSFVTILDDAVEVRWRNHFLGVWDCPNGGTVQTFRWS